MWKVRFVTVAVSWVIICSFSSLLSVQAFSSPGGKPCASTLKTFDDVSRRQLIQTTLATMLTIASSPASAAMKSDQKVFVAGKPLTEDEALVRLKEARISAQMLLDNYDAISNEGGDNVRRYLGTVGTTSGLWGIGKVLKALGERAEDIVEYTEVSNEVEKSIQQADGSAYMAIFVSTSSSSTPPSKYFGDAKIEVQRLNTALDEIGTLINVEFPKK